MKKKKTQTRLLHGAQSYAPAQKMYITCFKKAGNTQLFFRLLYLVVGNFKIRTVSN